jgi:hypothetical protein
VPNAKAEHAAGAALPAHITRFTKYVHARAAAAFHLANLVFCVSEGTSSVCARMVDCFMEAEERGRSFRELLHVPYLPEVAAVRFVPAA